MGLFHLKEERMIEGKIINLRAQEMSDLERNTRWLNDREVMRFLSGRYPWSLTAEENWLRDRTRFPQSYANAAFAIETKDGRHIGNCGIHEASPEDRMASVGILIGEKDCWGQGYGTDAMRTMLCFAFEEMNLHRIELDVYAFNERARASYRKCGFIDEVCKRQERFHEGRFIDVITMGILRHEWEAAP
jgi:RimJ/RimL family protein N-acetyltransferase